MKHHHSNPYTILTIFQTGSEHAVPAVQLATCKSFVGFGTGKELSGELLHDYAKCVGGAVKILYWGPFDPEETYRVMFEMVISSNGTADIHKLLKTGNFFEYYKNINSLR